LSGRGLCDELITRPEESYRLCCVVVCDLQTSRIGAPYINDISNLRVKQLHGAERLPSREAYNRLTDQESSSPLPPRYSAWQSIVTPTVSHHWTIFWSRCVHQHLRILYLYHINLDLPSARISSRRTIKLLWECSISCVRSTSSANQIPTDLIALT
jgi:hypothetical protein